MKTVNPRARRQEIIVLILYQRSAGLMFQSAITSALYASILKVEKMRGLRGGLALQRLIMLLRAISISSSLRRICFKERMEALAEIRLYPHAVYNVLAPISLACGE